MKQFGKVAVLYGGDSAEREVSLISGQAVYEALCRQGIDAHLVDSRDRQVVLNLGNQGFDRAFVMLHGRGGEDGQIQGVLQWLGIPYTGSGGMACALAMDKIMTKQVWASYGLPVLKDYVLQGNESYDEVCALLKVRDFAVKPALEGSSVGISRVRNAGEWQAALSHAKVGEQKVMVEPWVEGRELTCAVVDNQVLPLIEIITGKTHDFYDFHAKYQAEDTYYLCPAPLDADLSAEIAALTAKAFAVLDARAWGRVDIMLDQENRPWLLEINLAPGMTSHSLVPQAAAQAGMDFDALVLRVLTQTLESPA